MSKASTNLKQLAPLLQELRERGVGMMDYDIAPTYWEEQWLVPALETGVCSAEGEPTRDLLLRLSRTKLVVTDLPGIYRFGIGFSVPWQYAHTGARGKVMPEVSLFVSRGLDRLRACRFAAEMAMFAKALGGLDLTAHRDSYFALVGGKALGVVSGVPTGTALGPYSRHEVNDAVSLATYRNPSSILPCFIKLGWLCRQLGVFWQEYISLLAAAYSPTDKVQAEQLNKELDKAIYESLARPLEAVPKHRQQAIRKSAIIQALELARDAPAPWKAEVLYKCLVPSAMSARQFHESVMTKQQLESKTVREDVWRDVVAFLDYQLGELHAGRFG